MRGVNQTGLTVNREGHEMYSIYGLEAIGYIQPEDYDADGNYVGANPNTSDDTENTSDTSGEEDSYDESTESDQEYDSESDYSDEEEGYYDEEG